MNMLKSLTVLLSIASASLMPTSGTGQEIVFRDVTKNAGVNFLHTDGKSGSYYIVEYASAGLALFDFDSDGLVDIYFLNGANLSGEAPTNIPRNALYRNLGNMQFKDVTAQAGVGDTSHSLGVTVSDFDNDGDDDIYVSNYGPNVFYENNGDGTFRNMARTVGVANQNRVGAGVSFLDVDGDANLDLYVANYVKFAPDLHKAHTQFGVREAPAPRDYEPEQDFLFKSTGDGSFKDISEDAGISQHLGYGMGIISTDIDKDGDVDVFVCNDSQENFLLENQGEGRFEEIGVLAGIAYDYLGLRQGSMGVDCGDLNGDGFLDLIVTTYQDQLPAIYHNTGLGFLEDVSARLGMQRAYRSVNWGVGIVDFDSDGKRDIFLACGHLNEEISKQDDSLSNSLPNLVFHNSRRNSRFKMISNDVVQPMVSRGAAFDDLDNDGDVDAVIVNANTHATVLQNVTPHNNNWITISLSGSRTNRSAAGATCEITSGGLSQFAEVHCGRGYQSHYGTTLHFGYESSTLPAKVKIRWDRNSTEHCELGAKKRYVIVQGTSLDVGARIFSLGN